MESKGKINQIRGATAHKNQNGNLLGVEERSVFELELENYELVAVKAEKPSIDLKSSIHHNNGIILASIVVENFGSRSF